MTAPTKPIPALYTVYILRSTMRHASLYIGSTPDPPRRLKQHNGLIQGGAARTSRASLRPWEMVALVSGFPGAVAALKFEWALTNPHLSLHIPSDSRISVSRQTKKNGHPRRPPASMQSIMANLHLLLRVPSFGRWPLKLHVFVPDVFTTWQKWCETASQPTPDTLEVVTDFGPKAPEKKVNEVPDSDDDSASVSLHTTDDEPWGIHTLPVDYTPIQDYVDKARDIFIFEREGDCVHCHEHMPPGEGLYVVCPNASCEAVGHMKCWSEHMLANEIGAAEGGVIIPKQGTCPECGGPIVWADMMKELTLRLRSPNEIEKLTKAKRRLEKVETAEKAKAEKLAKAAAKKAAKTVKTTTATKVAKKAADKETTAKPKPRAGRVATKSTKVTKTTKVTKRASSPKTTKAKTTAATKTGSKTSASGQSSPEVIVL